DHPERRLLGVGVHWPASPSYVIVGQRTRICLRHEATGRRRLPPRPGSARLHRRTFRHRAGDRMPRNHTSRLAALMPVPVDLALVLAIDTSGSVSEERMALQTNGYADAFGSPSLLGEVRKGRLGRIAATFVQWSDSD